MINKSLALLLISELLLLANPVSADDVSTVAFSPYADLTYNTHWDPAYQDMEPMDLVKIAEEQGIQGFHLAFITDAGHCLPAWGGQSTYQIADKWGQHLATRLAQKGVQVTVSFGGASGNDLSMNCNVEELKLIFSRVKDIYQPTKLDFDIENGTTDVPTLIQALQIFQQQSPEIKISFTLPTMPEGLTPAAQDFLELAKAADLDFSVNIMAMDYGPAYSGNMGNYAIDAANSLYDELRSLYPNKSANELWQMIEITPMIGVNDVQPEQFTLGDAKKLHQFAQEKQIGLLSMWSIARDKPCADKWANPGCSGNNLQNKDYEFSQTLK